MRAQIEGEASPAQVPACRVAFGLLRRGPRRTHDLAHDGAHDATAVTSCLRGGRGAQMRGGGSGLWLLVALRGQLQVDSSHGVFRLRARRFLALPAVHCASVTADAHADWVALRLDESWLRALSCHPGYRDLGAPWLLPAAMRVDRALLRRLCELLRHAPQPGRCEAGPALAALLLAARAAQARAVDWVARACGRSERHRRNAVARLLGARNHILNAPFAAHDLRALAATARYSPSHFLRSFRDVFGMTPHELLTQTRLQLARDLIRDSRLAICEIAASVGYESRHAFSRSFKRATGVTATGYRLAGGNG